ncbi:hypothetical protein PYCC9005_001242 [Savitreella phatthalungensis]
MILLSDHEVDAAVHDAERFADALGKVWETSSAYATALNLLAEAAHAYSSHLISRRSYAPGGTQPGAHQVQLMCLSYSAQTFRSAAETQTDLSRTLQQGYERIDAACVALYEYLIRRNKLYAQQRISLGEDKLRQREQQKRQLQTAASKKRKALRRLTIPAESVLETVQEHVHLPGHGHRLSPEKVCQLKHRCKVTVKQRRFDLAIAQSASAAASTLFSNYSEGIASLGNEHAVAGLNKWRPFLGIEAPQTLHVIDEAECASNDISVHTIAEREPTNDAFDEVEKLDDLDEEIAEEHPREPSFHSRASYVARWRETVQQTRQHELLPRRDEVTLPHRSDWQSPIRTTQLDNTGPGSSISAISQPDQHPNRIIQDKTAALPRRNVIKSFFKKFGRGRKGRPPPPLDLTQISEPDLQRGEHGIDKDERYEAPEPIEKLAAKAFSQGRGDEGQDVQDVVHPSKTVETSKAPSVLSHKPELASVQNSGDSDRQADAEAGSGIG